jgi:hypothetical protein
MDCWLVILCWIPRKIDRPIITLLFRSFLLRLDVSVLPLKIWDAANRVLLTRVNLTIYSTRFIFPALFIFT